MSIDADLQLLAPGKRVYLFHVDGSMFDGPELFFHNYPIPYTEAELVAAGSDPNLLPVKSIWWRGQEYRPWPVQAEGFEVTSDGSAPTPTLSVANLDGTISAMCLAYQNMAQARVTRHFTFAQYLDARNYPDGNPEADPTKEKLDVYYIENKTSEDDEVIQFQLSSPADLQGMQIPSRQIHSLCTWCIRGQYRGPSCGYTGTNYFDQDGNPVDDPSKDDCGGLLSDCKKRWGATEQLPFGGFPGSALLKR